MGQLAELFLALVLGMPIVTVATVSGNQAHLCARMGGTFTPSHTEDVCPGGQWRNLVRRQEG